MKSSGELSSALPILRLHPLSPFSATDSFSGGRSTSNLKQRGTSKKIHCPLRVRESLSSHDCDIYHGYALIRQESTLFPASHPGTGSTRRILLISPFRLPSILALDFRFHCAFCPAPASVFLRRKNFCRICVSRWRTSYYRALLRRGITVTSLTFFIFLLSSSSHISSRFFFRDLFL